MMAILKSDNECCGCSACVSICPKNAIEYKPDAIGFLYPTVDYTKCVECGLCERVCQFSDKYDLKHHYRTPLAYAVRHKDIQEVETSRSGASFIAISDWVIENGGVVYGAGYKNHFIVSHIRAVSKEQRNTCKGSKYVQSDVSNIFLEVKKDLQENRIVLFSGTPCQVAGLKSYVGNAYENLLYTIDIICYGVPSPKLWNDYLLYIESRLKKRVVSVNFRNKKKFGWYDQKESFIFEDGTELDSNTYSLLFQNDYLRHSCFNCPYTNIHRVGDITLGDYWGWERTNKEFNADGKGCSLLLVNTPKGEYLFKEISSQVDFIQTTVDKILQPRLENPTERPSMLSEFESDYMKYGFKYIARKYSNLMDVFGDMPYRERIKRRFYSLYLKIQKFLKRLS